MADALFKIGSSGSVPEKVGGKIKGFNFTNDKNANGHNEGRVSAACGGFSIFRDTFEIAGTAIDDGKGYRLEIQFDSWSRVPLWNHGRIFLSYDATKEAWTMDAKVDGRGWGFCDAGKAVDRIVAGLRCFETVDGKGAASDAGRVFAASIEKGRNAIIEGAKKYVNSSGEKVHDCSYDPPGQEIDWSDAPLYMD
jgi:hypothetical protein